jgi:hypothetical protein
MVLEVSAKKSNDGEDGRCAPPDGEKKYRWGLPGLCATFDWGFSKDKNNQDGPWVFMVVPFTVMDVGRIGF